MDRRTTLLGAALSGLVLVSVFVRSGGDPLAGVLGVGAVAVLTLWLN